VRPTVGKAAQNGRRGLGSGAEQLKTSRISCRTDMAYPEKFQLALTGCAE